MYTTGHKYRTRTWGPSLLPPPPPPREPRVIGCPGDPNLVGANSPMDFAMVSVNHREVHAAALQSFPSQMFLWGSAACFLLHACILVCCALISKAACALCFCVRNAERWGDDSSWVFVFCSAMNNVGRAR